MRSDTGGRLKLVAHLLCLVAVVIWDQPAAAFGGFVFKKSPDSCYRCTDSGGAMPVPDSIPHSPPQGESPQQPQRPLSAIDFDHGSGLFEAGHYNEALPYLKRAAEKEPANVQYQRWLAECLSRLGQREQAVSVLNNLLHRSIPTDLVFAITAERDRIEGLIRKQAAAEAKRDIDKIVAEQKDKAVAIAKATAQIDTLAALAKNDSLVQRARARNIVRGIQRIEVPPPIPAQTAQIQFGQLGPRDIRTNSVLFGTEAGLAALDMAGRISKGPLIWAKVLLISGETLIADLDGAQVYVARQNALYDKALGYLRDPETRSKFADISRRLKVGRPLPEHSSIDMVRAAEALLDPKLGNSTAFLVWDAMMSPEAKNAALTRLGIELLAEGVGTAAGRTLRLEMTSRDVAANRAVDFLSHAKVALAQTKDPVAIKSLQEAITLANEIISKSYHAMRPGVAGMEAIETFYAKWKLEQGREISVPRD